MADDFPDFVKFEGFAGQAWYHQHMREKRILRRAREFTPERLLEKGEQGVWYDPSDTTTLFQDSAGTTPVTASGQPVGLMLDKSKGLVLGSEKWAAPVLGSTWVDNGGGSYTTNNPTGAFDELAVTVPEVGKWYKVSFSYNVSNQPITFRMDGLVAISIPAGAGTITGYANADATGTTKLSFARQTGGLASTATISNISVRELTGNHATQPTAASRPIYRRGDSRGVVNLLTWSEDFSNAAWNRSDTTVSAGLTFGGYSTQLLTQGSAGTGFVTQLTSANRQAGEVTASRVFARGDSDWVLLIVGDTGAAANAGRAWFNLASGTKGTATVVGTATGVTSDIVPVTGGAYRCTVSATIPGTTANSVSQIVFSDGSTGRKSGNRYEGAAQLNLGPTALPYQRNDANLGGVATGASTDLHWLETDGVDDGMATGNINFTGTDKVSVFAGVRKRSDAARAMLLELSAAGSAGSFAINAPVSTGSGFSFVSTGSTPAAIATLATAPSPISAVLSCVGDMAADTCSLFVDGQLAASRSADQGTGNYGNYPLYLFRRGGTTLPFNGWFYGLAITGRLTTDAETVATERYLAAKASVVIP